MILLHNIGPRRNSNYNTLEEILASTGPISFDGIYTSVWDNYEALKGRDVTFFVMGNYLGLDNSFDKGMPLERYCTWIQIDHMVKELGAHLGWHTFSHPDLTRLSDEQVRREVTPPFPMERFAYPAGAVDKRVAKIVEEAGYKEAWSVTQGDGSQFQRKRRYLNW